MTGRGRSWVVEEKRVKEDWQSQMGERQGGYGFGVIVVP